MTRDGYRVSFLDSKPSVSSPEKDLIPTPDTYQLIHDDSLGKRLDVGDSSQIHPYQLPSNVLENYDGHFSQTLPLHGNISKRPQRSKNYREYNMKPSNDMKATVSHSCGDLLTSLSNPDSSSGRLLKLSSGNSFLSFYMLPPRTIGKKIEGIMGNFRINISFFFNLI
jgi:leucine-rich repeat-containing protein 36